MEYVSTRDDKKKFTFSQVVLEGLAPDGGLFVPTHFPDFSKKLDELAKLNYQELATRLFIPFCEPCLLPQEIKNIVSDSYQLFPNPPLKIIHLKKNSILELFHGPTLSFKDYALQFVTALFNRLLNDKQSLNILVATSGDTGSAAIRAVANKPKLRIFTLYPDEKISLVQKLQMTTTQANNVHNLAVQGDFDDCQKIIKQIFENLEFKKKFSLSAVNSINWARILGQITHYFYAGLRQKNAYPNEPLNFCVPTGNFGHIYAGLVAKKMGLKIDNLFLATNKNDILTRLINQGEYQIRNTHFTLSPAMDIQKASNFERYLYLYYNQNTKKVAKTMADFTKTGNIQLDKRKIQKDFQSYSADDKDIATTIKETFAKENYLLDTHTAVGMFAAKKLAQNRCICLATAHPAKFYKSIESIIEKKIIMPHSISELFTKKEYLVKTSAQKEKIMDFLEKKIPLTF